MSDRQQPRVRKRGGVTVTRARMDLRWLYGTEIAQVHQGGSPSPRAVTVMATLAQLSAPVVETLRAAHLPSRDVPRPLRLLVAPLDPRLVVLVAARQGVAPDAVDALFTRVALVSSSWRVWMSWLGWIVTRPLSASHELALHADGTRNWTQTFFALEDCRALRPENVLLRQLARQVVQQHLGVFVLDQGRRSERGDRERHASMVAEQAVNSIHNAI